MSQKEGGQGRACGGMEPVADASRGPVAVSSAEGVSLGGASASPRAALAADLAGHLARLLAAGDIEGARIAHEMIGRLLTADPSGGAAVLDLATERRRRER